MDHGSLLLAHKRLSCCCDCSNKSEPDSLFQTEILSPTPALVRLGWIKQRKSSMIAANPLYQSAHNYELSLRVENALLRADPNGFRRISVVAFHGIVELCGSVASKYQKRLALNIAERVPGVTTVVESVLIRNENQPRQSVVRLRRPDRMLPKDLAQRVRNSSGSRDDSIE